MKTVKVFETTSMPVDVWTVVRDNTNIGAGEVVTWFVGYSEADAYPDPPDPDGALVDKWLIEQGATWGDRVIIVHGTFYLTWTEVEPKLAERVKR